MFKDPDGNEYQILQMLHDAVMLERRSLTEKLTSLEENIDQGRGIGAVLGDIALSQQMQMDHLMRAIGNLESRIMAVQKAAGIDEVAYPAVDIHHERTDEQ